jgi:peroxiredoxin
MMQSLVVWMAFGLLGSANLGQTPGAYPDVELQELPGREPGLESGYGHAHFPITSRQRRTQLYFDQGLAMLHGFAPRAAQRSFQKALTLEPEAPMLWCAMALATLDQPEQARYFLKQANRWRSSGTAREKAWIGALERCLLAPNQSDGELGSRLATAWKELSAQSPDDIEAKALYVKYCLESATRDPSTSQALSIDDDLRAVLRKDPRHALHASIILQCRRKPRDQVIPMIEKACQASPRNPQVWMRAGQLCIERGLPAHAVTLLENALRQHHREMARDNLVPDKTPGYAEACDGLVTALAMCGRFDAALKFSRHMLTFPSTRVWSWDSQYRAPDSLCILGAWQIVGLLADLGRWQDLAEFTREMDVLGPDLESERCLARCQAAFGLRDQVVMQEQAQQLLRNREHFESQRRRLETEPRLKRKLRDPAGAARDWSRRIEKIDLALNEVRLYTALVRKDLPAARAELGRIRRHDGLHARIALALGDRADSIQAIDCDLKAAPADVRVAYRCRELLRQLGDRPRLEELESRWREKFNLQHTDAQPEDVLWSPPLAPDWALADRDGELHSLDDYRGKPLLLVLYLGAGCPHCIEQLLALAPMKSEFDRARLSVVTVSTDSIEGLRSTFQVVGAEEALPYLVVSDESKATFRAYGAWNESRSAALHGVFLIDGRGRQLWSEVGKEPFMATRFLLSECERLLARKNGAETRPGKRPRED